MATGYSVAIGVVDNATKQINAINKRIAAAQAPFNRLSSSISKFSDLSGISKVQNGIKSVVGFAERLLGTIGRLLPAFGLLTGAASVAGLYRLAEGFANLGSQLANDAAKIGTTGTTLQNYQNAARLAGVSSDDMTSSLEGLSQAMQEAMTTPNEASAVFAKFGINIRDSAYQAKSGAEKMGDAFEVIKKLNDGGASAATQLRVLSDLHMSPNLLRWAQQGRQGLEDLRREAAGLGGLNQDQIDKAIALRKSITEVQIATENLANGVMAALSPAITPLLDQFGKWIAQNQQFVQTKAAEYAKQFADWVSSINWSQTIQSFQEMLKHVDSIVTSLGGLTTVTETLIGLWVGGKVLGMIANLAKIASILSIPAEGAGLFVGLSKVAALLTNPATIIGAGAVAGFMAQTKAGERDIDTGTKADQMGYKPMSVDDAGHVTAYKNDQGKIMTPDDVDEEYKKRGGGSAGMPFGVTAPMSTPEMDKAAKDAYDDWIKMGKSPTFAAAMVSQEQAESGFRPGARGDMGNAGGLFQWHKDRRDAILAGSGIDVYSEKDPHKQRMAANWELDHTETVARDRIAAATTSADAGAAASIYYERPGDQQGQAHLRSLIARQRYEQFHNLRPGSPVASSPATPPEQQHWWSGLLGNLTGQPSAPAPSTTPTPPSIVAPPTASSANINQPPQATANAPQNGKVDVNVHITGGAADQARVSAKASGGLIDGAPSVVRPMSPNFVN